MGSNRHLNIAITFRREYSPEKVLTYAQQAERLGFRETWVVEDCFFASGIASAAAILASTEAMRVGVGIMPIVARNPVFSAMEIATIGRMYPGRFTAGVGHGVARWMRQIGALPDSQMAALREGVEITRGLLRGETVDYQGEQYYLDQGQLAFPPEVTPPIYLGVRGPKSLALAGEIADGTILAEFSSPTYVGRARTRIRAGNQSGREHHVAVFVYTCATDSIAEGVELVRPLAAKAIASGRKDMYFKVFGDPELLESLKAMDDKDEMAKRIPDSWIEQLAIMGRRGDWEKQMAAFTEAGADTMVLVPLPELGMAQMAAFSAYLF